MVGTTKREYSDGEIIFQQGTEGDDAFIIEKGKIEISRTDATGHKKIIAYLGERDIFGEIALVSECRRTATATAVEDCVVVIITHEQFKSLPPDNPGVKKLKSVMAERIEEN